MIDAHNHLQQIEGLPEVGSWDDFNRELGIDLSVVNGTGPEDWEQVFTLCQGQKTLFPCVGFHPWKIEEKTSLDEGMVALEKALLRPPDAATGPRVGIGETGLDRWKNPDALPWQEPFFREQIRLARKFELPLTVHCLKAWGALEKIIREERLPDRGFLLHAFGGAAENLDFWLKKGAFFSFSSCFVGPSYQRHRKVFQQIPVDRILLETDAPAMAPPDERVLHRLPPQKNPQAKNHPANLELAAESLREITGLSLLEVKKITTQNAQRLYTP